MKFKVYNIPIPENGPICDFCSSPAAVWKYFAQNSYAAIVIQNELIINESIGNWAACEECSTLIEAGKRSDLTNRSFFSLPKETRQGIPDDLIRDTIINIQEGFWANRFGTRERIGGEA